MDTGGTFTDVVGYDPKEGVFHSLKLLSRSTENHPHPAIEGIRRMLGLGPGDPLPHDIMQGVRFGTTVATNCLLERKGCRVGLVITKGFGDLLEIGHQSRPDIFSLCVQKPKNLYSHVFEVSERIGGTGQVVKPLDSEELKQVALALKAAGVEAVAVVFINSWKNPVHEELAGRVLFELGFRQVFLSHKVKNLIKVVSRGRTAVLDAYLNQALSSYITGIREQTGPVPVSFMKSSGSLSKAEEFMAHDALLSGPAGGVLAVASVCSALGLKGAVGFDMGGTSTDVSRFDGEFQRAHESTVSGVEFQADALDIVTIASGGGSLLWFDGGRMRVGPESAGSDPGPASYGFGGPLAVTDANLVTGRLLPGYFPSAFGPERDAPLSEAAARKKFHELSLKAGPGASTDIEALSLGFLRVVNERMALAIKEISVSRGVDVRDYALVCFGGAGGQHACEVASMLGIRAVVFHPLGPLMSAYGIGLADSSKKVETTALLPYDADTHKEIEERFAQMEQSLGAGQGVVFKRELDLRPAGADTFITLSPGGYEETLLRFRDKYAKRFGFYPEGVRLEAVNLRVEAVMHADFFPPYSSQKSDSKVPKASGPVSVQKVLYLSGWLDVPVYEASGFLTGHVIKGPAIFVDECSTLILDPNFEASANKDGVITANRVSDEVVSDEVVSYEIVSNEIVLDKIKSQRLGQGAPEPDPVLLEVFNNTFSSVASEMGYTLENTAHSVNIKERRDFSCAVFDAGGALVANAPHIPVHLGSMTDTVKSMLKKRKANMRPGDFYLTNDPYAGGSHLPDMTVVCPVFSASGDLLFFTASRGHHADVGGTVPGSMPPFAAHISEEGVLIEDFLLIRDNRFDQEGLLLKLLGHKYPARNPKETIADLKAQAAACGKGVQELRRVIARYGWHTVSQYMGHVRKNADTAVRRALWKFLKHADTFKSAFSDRLDDGTPICVAVSITAGDDPPATVSCLLDFIGTGPQHEKDNLNTPLPVTRSAVIYVLRAITGQDIPLNSGCLGPVEIRVPKGSILNPSYPCAVASGNVETSQRVVDVLLGALGAAAASQGTMNNLLFEVQGETPYYETVAGGSGASPGCPGASGVQVHMTNTRITDPEVLEQRHPGVRLKRFTLREGSGGQGRYKGGEGVVRELQFLKPAEVSIISERRKEAPYGLEGGGPGQKGRNLHVKANGDVVELPHRVSLSVRAGESIVLETPGGGGYGKGD